MRRSLLLISLTFFAGFAKVCLAKKENQAVNGLLNVGAGQFKPNGGHPVPIDLSGFPKGALNVIQELDGTVVDVGTIDGRVMSILEWRPIGRRGEFSQFSITPERVVAHTKMIEDHGQFFIDVPGKSGFFRLRLNGQTLSHDDIPAFVSSNNVRVEGTLSDDGSSIDLIQLTNRTSGQSICEKDLTQS